MTDAGRCVSSELLLTRPAHYTDDGSASLGIFTARRPSAGCASWRVRPPPGQERRDGLREAIAAGTNSLDRYPRSCTNSGWSPASAKSIGSNEADRGRTCCATHAEQPRADYPQYEQVKRHSVWSEQNAPAGVYRVSESLLSASATARSLELVQGVQYYYDATRTYTMPGLMHVNF